MKRRLRRAISIVARPLFTLFPLIPPLDRWNQRRRQRAAEVRITQIFGTPEAINRREAALRSLVSRRSQPGVEPARKDVELTWPVAGRLTYGFGERHRRPHYGIDIAAPTGTAVRAAADGTVIFSGWLDEYGTTVVIDHGADVSTLYAHLIDATTKEGRHVSRQQVFGHVGSTGRSTGPHLHFEVRIGGEACDPLTRLSGASK